MQCKMISRDWVAVGVLTVALLGCGTLAALPACAADNTTTDIGSIDKETVEKVFPNQPPYSPYADRKYPTRPYFGDTHLHTAMSMDAGAFGCRLSPRDAYL